MDFIDKHIDKIPYLLLFILIILIIFLVVSKLKTKNKKTSKSPDLMSLDPYSSGEINLMTKDPALDIPSDDIKPLEIDDKDPLGLHLTRETPLLEKIEELNEPVLTDAFNMNVPEIEILDVYVNNLHKTQKFCPSCKTPNDLLNKFCTSCGHDFEG